MQKKATTFDEIDAAVQFRTPVKPDSPFFTDFSDARGSFKERKMLLSLKLSTTKPHLLKAPPGQGVLVFLAGMYGSGKTSELYKLMAEIENPNGYLCIPCSLDTDLDMNNIDLVDILIFQVELLAKRANDEGISIDSGVIQSLMDWFTERTRETNKMTSENNNLEVEAGAGFSLATIFTFATRLKSAFAHNIEYAEKARSVLRRNFSDLAMQFNQFISEVVLNLQKAGKAADVLFIIDGLEKIQTAEMRRRIIIDDGLRLREIRANMLMTMPIELHHKVSELRIVEPDQIIRFPFIKLFDSEATEPQPAAVQKLQEFLFRRVDESLFETSALANDIILMSGGSPRELLRLVQQMVIETEEDEPEKLTRKSFEAAVNYLANILASGLTKEDLELLRELHNQRGQIEYSERLNELLARVIVMEYNDGSYKRVNPVIARSKIYQKYVG